VLVCENSSDSVCFHPEFCLFFSHPCLAGLKKNGDNVTKIVQLNSHLRSAHCIFNPCNKHTLTVPVLAAVKITSSQANV
ncbi:AGAP011543-PA, partial [Anopheles gambiae str. PEST]